MLAASLAAAVLGAPAKVAEKADSNPNLHFAENRFARPRPPSLFLALAFLPRISPRFVYFQLAAGTAVKLEHDDGRPKLLPVAAGGLKNGSSSSRTSRTELRRLRSIPCHFCFLTRPLRHHLHLHQQCASLAPTVGSALCSVGGGRSSDLCLAARIRIRCSAGAEA